MSTQDPRNAHLQEKLEQAADTHDFERIAALVAEGANPDSGLRGFASLLIYAIKQGQRKLVTSLLDAGASTELADDAGDTPLMHAARNGQDDIVELLLERGANPLAENKAGKTATGTATEGAKSLMDDFNDNASMGISDIQSASNRFERIGSMLAEAKAEKAKAEEAKRLEISSYHAGLDADLAIRPPLKLKTPEL